MEKQTEKSSSWMVFFVSLEGYYHVFGGWGGCPSVVAVEWIGSISSGVFWGGLRACFGTWNSDSKVRCVHKDFIMGITGTSTSREHDKHPLP
jgi:hypothetical protein